MGIQDRDYIKEARSSSSPVMGWVRKSTEKVFNSVFLYLGIFYLALAYLFINLANTFVTTSPWYFKEILLITLACGHVFSLKKHAYFIATALFTVILILVAKSLIPISVHFDIVLMMFLHLAMLATFFMVSFLLSLTQFFNNYSIFEGIGLLSINCLGAIAFLLWLDLDLSLKQGIFQVISLAICFSYHYFFVLRPSMLIHGVVVLRGNSVVEAQKVFLKAIFLYPIWKKILLKDKFKRFF
jgi:hypothetical protein